MPLNFQGRFIEAIILKDSLGSASVATDSTGVTVGEDRFYPFWETRFTKGNMQTDKLFTGQRQITGLGIVLAMKHVIACLLVMILLTSCRGSFPPTHLPAGQLAKEQLSPYVISYCWQDPEGRQSKARPENREVVVVISSADGNQRLVVRNQRNLPGQQLSDFIIYKEGCVAEDDTLFRYVGSALSWMPQSDELTFSEGSDQSLTRFDSRILMKDFTVTPGQLNNMVEGYQDHFVYPRGVYWSSDGKRFATLGRDVDTLASNGDNLWMYDDGTKSFRRVTDFSGAGAFIANASWSWDGSRLAVEYRQQSGIGIAAFDESANMLSYVDVTSKIFPELDEYWPYTYQSMSQLLFQRENVGFNSYVSTNSLPVWVNNDKQIIFAAADKSGQGTLFIVNSDGSDLKPFAPDLSGLVFMPRLAPDGRTLAFVRYPSWNDKSRTEIATVDIFTKKVTSLLVLPVPKNKDTLFVSGMNWSPDGKYLAFSSNHAGESDVYVVSSDGKSWLNLTGNVNGNAISPFWKP